MSAVISNLRAEWTKFRTVRASVVGLVAAAVVTVLFGLLTASGIHSSMGDVVGHPFVPSGPGGEAVTDSFTFVHQPLEGDGTITARVTSLTGVRAAGGRGGRGATDPLADTEPELPPWAKAGLMMKDGTAQGSSYAAVMATGAHGVRMQHDFVHDTAGRPQGVSEGSPVWLRLTRAGDTLTGYESADGTSWNVIGTASLAGSPATVEAGLFVTSPPISIVERQLGGMSETGAKTRATGVFDQVGLDGNGAGGSWSGERVGVEEPENGPVQQGPPYRAVDGTFTVEGTGDVAPLVGGYAGIVVERTLAGVFVGLIVVIVIGALFVTVEYRRGLIRTTLAASPNRGGVLAAKAFVVGAVTFVAGLLGGAVTMPLAERVLVGNGNFVYPVTALTQLRVVAGTAALLAVTAVLALAVGVVLRRSAAAVTTVIVLVVLPYVLATASVLPDEASLWLLRVTPAAGFAVQQSVPQYPQASSYCPPAQGCYPLPPWAGFAVLCAYAAAGLVLAAVLLRRRDA